MNQHAKEPEPPVSPVVRLLLVDELTLVRASVRATLEKVGFEVVAEAGTVAEAIAAAVRFHPDVVLLEARLPDGSGVDACRGLRAACPEARMLFLGGYADEEALFATLFAIADGYVLKEIRGDQLAHAIRAVSSGLSVLSPNARQSLVERLLDTVRHAGNPGSALSPQERQALELAAEGKTNTEIAAAMALSPKTVKNYFSRVFRKLKVTRRSAAVARLLRDKPRR